VTPYAGLAPLTTQFDASGSSDPDGDALTYKWDFGDGTTGTGAKPSHTYGFNGHYTATVTVSDPGGATAKASVTVVVGDRAPTVSFVKPDSAFRYSDGVPVDLQVNVSDPEDGTLSGESISWQVILQHNQHQHYIATATGASTSFTPLVTHGADSFYLVTVTATDSAGVATTKTLRVDPKLVNIRLSTNPASGVELGFDGGLFADPFSAQTVPGFQTTIVAPDTITDSSGRKLVFASWTDGGAATHDITIPNGDVQLVANYRSDTTPPDTVLDSGPAATTRNHQPRFFFHSTEPPYWFQCRMDSESWVGCASGWSPPKPLTNGTHKFAVRAWDSADNFDPTPATQQFTVIP
jgi:PKD repeat protein